MGRKVEVTEFDYEVAADAFLFYLNDERGWVAHVFTPQSCVVIQGWDYGHTKGRVVRYDTIIAGRLHSMVERGRTYPKTDATRVKVARVALKWVQRVAAGTPGESES